LTAAAAHGQIFLRHALFIAAHCLYGLPHSFLYRRESLGVEKYFTLSRIGRLKIFRLAKNQFYHFAVYLSKKKRANKRPPAIIKILLLINILERYANFIA